MAADKTKDKKTVDSTVSILDCAIEKTLGKKTTDKAKVLILLPLVKNLDTLPKSVKERYDIYCQSQHDEFTLLDYMRDACKLIEDNNITICLATSDEAAILLGALIKRFPHLRGPSIESVFIANNKYYTRCLLDPSPPAYSLIDVSSVNTLYNACERACETIGTLPAIAKPTMGALSKGVAIVKDINELFYQAEMCSKSNSVFSFHKEFMLSHIDMNLYPFAAKPCLLVEEYIHAEMIVTLEGYVRNNDIQHWEIIDSIYWKSRPMCYIGFAAPTVLSEETQDRAWKMYNQIVSKMIEHGFNDQFVNIEVFVQLSGDVKLLEVNPRIGLQRRLKATDTMTLSQLMISEGLQPVGKSCVNGPQHSLDACLITFGKGLAKDFLDFDNPNIFPMYSPDDYIDGSIGVGGACLANAFITGDSRDDLMGKFYKLLDKALLQPRHSPMD